MKSKLLVPKPFYAFIAKLVRLSEIKLSILYNLLDSDLASDDESESLINEMGSRLEITNQDTIQILNTVYNLSRQKDDFNIEDIEFISELKSLYKGSRSKSYKDLVDEIEKKKELILKVVGPKPKAERYEKIRYLKTGLIKTANSFRSFCDIRPLYNSKRDRIEDLIPIIIMEIEFENDEEVVFQLNKESFSKLQEFIEYTNGKLKVLENFIEISTKDRGQN